MFSKASTHSHLFNISAAKMAPTWLRLLFLTFVCLVIITAQPMQAQSYNVIYNLTDGNGLQWFEDYSPQGGLVLKDGNLYGTLPWDGGRGRCCGRVFELTNGSSGWTFSPIFIFQGGPYGLDPSAIFFGADGNIYGTTELGGGCGWGCGTLFQLQPPGRREGREAPNWRNNLLYRFPPTKPIYPTDDLAMDQAGNIYGVSGGLSTLYEMSPSDNGWAESDIFYFNYLEDGVTPRGGVIIDHNGALYGTTYGGGHPELCNGWGCGVVYQFVHSTDGWTENVLYAFQDAGDGRNPHSSVVMDSAGNLYGTTTGGGTNGVGTVFQLSPGETGWTLTTLYNFTGGFPGKLTVDAAGNLYGTTAGVNEDTVYKLTPGSNGWTYADLHNFSCDTGCSPYGKLVVAPDGGIYGMTSQGGSWNYGVIFEITP